MGATPTWSTNMRKCKYLHKLVEIKYDGKPEIGFVVEETGDYYGGIQIRVLLQRLNKTVFFDTNFNKPKLLEE